MSQSASAKYVFRSSVGCDPGKVLLHATGLPLPTTRRLNASATSGTSLFVVKDRVPSALIPVNPMGLTITYFREDQAFE